MFITSGLDNIVEDLIERVVAWLTASAPKETTGDPTACLTTEQVAERLVRAAAHGAKSRTLPCNDCQDL